MSFDVMESMSIRARAPFRVRSGLTLFFGVALALWSIASWLTYLNGARTLGVHIVASAPALYFLCICIHDGVHGVLWSSRRTNQVASFLLSWVIHLPFPLLQTAHLYHHKHVGRESDPEHVVYSVSIARLLLRLPLIPVYYLRAFRLLHRRARVMAGLHLVVSGAFIATVTVVGGSAALVGWLAPLLLAIAWFGFTTVYIPHSKNAATWMRYFNTHSGWHFDHHRDTRYPFSQYAQLRDFHLRTGIFDGPAWEHRYIGALARRVGRRSRPTRSGT